MIQVIAEQLKTQKLAEGLCPNRPKGERACSAGGFPEEIPVSKSAGVILAAPQQNHKV